MDNQLSKTCVACGLQKPLTAFLQISGPEGSSYGNVCSTCRGSGLGRKIVIPEIEEERSSSSSTGLKIDAKAKQQMDRDKKNKIEEKYVLEEKEEAKHEKEKKETIERKENKAEAERDHRENYLEKKESFLNYQSKKPGTTAQSGTVLQKQNDTQKTVMDRLNQVDMQNKQEGAKAEDAAKNVDLSIAHVDSANPGEMKYQSAEFLKMRAYLGNSAAINTIERQFLAKKTSHMANPSAEDKLVEFLGEKFEPKSPKTRR